MTKQEKLAYHRLLVYIDDVCKPVMLDYYVKRGQLDEFAQISGDLFRLFFDLRPDHPHHYPFYEALSPSVFNRRRLSDEALPTHF